MKLSHLGEDCIFKGKILASDFFFKSSPEDMFIDFRDRGREREREREREGGRERMKERERENERETSM